MPTTYTGNPNNYSGTISVPTGDPAHGYDPFDPDSFDPALRQLLDNDASLAARQTADESSLDDFFKRIIMVANWFPPVAGPATGGATVCGACRNPFDRAWWFTGGVGSSAKTFRLVDDSQSWTDMAMPTTGINGDALDVCTDASGNVQVIFQGVAHNQTYFYNGTTGAWSAGVANLPTALDTDFHTVFFSGKFVTVSGSGAMVGCYVDPAAPTVATSMPSPSSPPGTIANVGHSRAYLANGKLYWCPLQQTGGWPFMIKIDDPTSNAGWTYPSLAITTNEGIFAIDYSTTSSKYLAAVVNTSGAYPMPATGCSTRFFTSTDGTTWTLAAGTIPEGVVDMRAMNGFWVAYTNTGTIYSSRDDGASWISSGVGVGAFATAETGSGRLLAREGKDQLCAVSLNASAPSVRVSFKAMPQ